MPIRYILYDRVYERIIQLIPCSKLKEIEKFIKDNNKTLIDVELRNLKRFSF